MAKAKSVHSTPRRTAPKIEPQKPAPHQAINPDIYPDVYCLSLDGDCLEPLIPNGAAVVLKKSEKIAVGDFITVWFRPGIIKEGHSALLKRLTLNVPHWVKFPYRDHPQSDVKAIVMFEQLNPRQTYTVFCDQIHAIHKAIGYVPAGAPIGGSIKAADILPMPTRKAVS
jgi:hypothetical protein